MAFFQADNLWINELNDGVAVLFLHVGPGGANPLTRAALDDLDVALQRVSEAGRFRLLIFRSGKANQFASGPGIDEMAGLKTPNDFEEFARRGQNVFEKLAQLPVPTVAMIAGACQGGGLELALACDYRVAVEESAARFGFGEMELNLIPAWGGTVRLPRLVGLERSLQMLLGDRQVSAGTAFDWGLVDAVVRRNEDQPPGILDRPVKRAHTTLPLRTWRQRLMEGLRGGRWLIYRGAKRLLNRKVPDELPAPFELLEAIRSGVESGVDVGLRREREAVVRLGQNDAFRNLLQLHAARKRIREQHGNAEGKTVRRVAVVGAGTHGSQIVALAAGRGLSVVVREIDEPALGKSMFRVLTLFQNSLEQGHMTQQDVRKNLSLISGTIAWKGVADVDVVLEATGVGGHDRRELLREIEKESGPTSLLVTTSGLHELEEFRESLREPARLGALHFVSPVGRGAIVEVVKTGLAAERVRELTSWLVRLGAMPIVVRDSPGLLVQRVWLAAIHEAILLLQEELPALRIEQALRRFGMLRGPLELADLMGARRLERLAAELPERFPLMETFFALMVSRGWLGHETKLGFYAYPRRGRPRPNKHITAIAGRDATPLTAKVALSRREQMDLCEGRIVARTVNEAAWCWEEGVVESALDIDVALAGAGWAPHRGGPLTYVRQQGIDDSVTLLEEFASQLGPRFAPCPALRRLR